MIVVKWCSILPATKETFIREMNGRIIKMYFDKMQMRSNTFQTGANIIQMGDYTRKKVNASETESDKAEINTGLQCNVENIQKDGDKR